MAAHSTTTKRDLVAELSERIGLTQQRTTMLFQAMLDLMIEQLAAGNEITLRRFGTFKVRIARAKVGRNPRKNGSEMTIPTRAVVKFKPGKELKAVVAELPHEFHPQPVPRRDPDLTAAGGATHPSPEGAGGGP